jgi:hypothetical protein
MATVQASSHFDVVYGPKYADALRDIFPGTVVMYGAHERHCSNRPRIGLGWPTAEANPTNPMGEAARSPHNSAPRSTGKSYSPKTSRRRSCCCAEPPDDGSRFPTGASSSTSTTRRSPHAVHEHPPKQGYYGERAPRVDELRMVVLNACHTRVFATVRMLARGAPLGR